MKKELQNPSMRTKICRLCDMVQVERPGRVLDTIHTEGHTVSHQNLDRSSCQLTPTNPVIGFMSWQRVEASLPQPHVCAVSACGWEAVSILESRRCCTAAKLYPRKCSTEAQPRTLLDPGESKDLATKRGIRESKNWDRRRYIRESSRGILISQWESMGSYCMIIGPKRAVWGSATHTIICFYISVVRCHAQKSPKDNTDNC